MKDLTFEKILEEETSFNKFIDLYSLSHILRYSVIAPTLNLTNFNIPLSRYGQKVFDHTKNLKKNSGFSVQFIKYVLLTDLYQNELYIDLNSVDIKYLKNFINEKIINKEILLPWVYDRLLYDKYFDQFAEQDYLNYDETLRLLNDCPQGVFQINKYVTGPFGLLESDELRMLVPSLEIKLWHCSSPSCGAFHTTKLEPRSNDFINIISSVREYCKRHYTTPYGKLFHDFNSNDDDYYNDKSIDNIVGFIINNFVEVELKLLLQILLDETDLRDSLPKNNLFNASSDKITSSLTKAQCSQLLLLSSDEKIVAFTEKLINLRRIYIPSTEIRSPIDMSYNGYYNTYPECNMLGLRIISASNDLSMVRLKFLLKEIYKDPSKSGLLEWKLKNYPDAFSLDEKIEHYIMDEDPKKIIRETVMAGSDQLNQTFEILGGYFFVPRNDLQEEATIEKILWKLGFSINLYPDTLPNFYEYLKKLEYVTTKVLNYNENDKAEIRSEAVNLFVSLEEILQLTLSYNTWLLLSDHYTNTKFSFVYEDAREFMAEMLNGFEITDGEFLELDKNDKNTLYPLLEGFTALFKICDNLIIKGRDFYKKPNPELPHFYENDNLKQFPFVSKHLVLDVRADDYENIKTILTSIPIEFSKANVLSIRNRLQHKRDEFPTQDEILKACYCINNVISKIDSVNLYPNVYLFKEVITDQYKKTKVIYNNYKGNPIKIVPTPEFENMHLPSLYVPQLIYPYIRMGNTSHPIRFAYKEKSEYQKFWKDYPRKKIVDEEFDNLIEVGSDDNQAKPLVILSA